MSDESRYRVIRSEDLQRSPLGTVAWEGESFGSEVSVFIIDYPHADEGPNLHKHPYPETWIVREGRARFTVDTQDIEAGPGDIVVCDAETPHKFKSMGSGHLKVVCIHPSPRFIQEDLE